jgi:hypothetical protein
MEEIVVIEELNTDKVFVSYAHDTPEHEEKVLSLCNDLCYHYIDCNCDQFVEDGNPERGWPAWMEENLRISKFVLVVASEKYLTRFENKEKDGVGLGAKWESILSAGEIYENDFKNMKYIPVYFGIDNKKYIPTFLKPFTHYDLSNVDRLKELRLRLKGQLPKQKPVLGPPQIKNDSQNETLPTIPEFTNDMKPGMKILQAFFVLPLTTRFQIALELGLVENGENYNDKNADELCGKFLIRAKERNILAQLWTKLFNETVDPNPFLN